MSRSVAIVDDNAGFRASARRVLEAEGYTVLGEAEDGRSGVEIALGSGAEIAIVDVQLPDIDGFEVARRICAGWDSPAVILISSRDGSDFGPLIELSCARGFIPKAELTGSRLEALVS